VGKKLRRRDDARAARFFAGAATEKERNDVALLTRAVTELKASGKGSVADDAVTALFVHRDAGVRTAAVAAYAERCRKLKSPTGPLKDIVTKGTRELLLGAAEGLAWVHGAAVGDLCLVPLLLISRASEADDDRERALVALGRLGDARALPELELIADGGAEDAPVSDGMRRAAIEALGRLHNGLSDHDARARVRDRVEAASADDDDDVAYRAVRALRAIGDDWAAHLLVRVLAREPGEQVCREACEAVAALKVTAAEPALADLLGNWDDDIRKPARKALDRLFPGDRARVELLVLDHSEDSDEQQAAAAFLATAGEPGALLERLRDLADDDLKATLRHGLARRPSLPQAAVVALIDSARADVVREGALLLVERDPDRDAAAYGDALGRAFGRLVDKDDVKLTATIVDVLSAQKRQYRPAALAVATARVADPRRCRRPRCAARSSTSSPARAALETGASLDVSASVLADSLSSLSFRLSAAGVAAQQRARLGAHERAALWASS
jgi:ParB family chromosome partitioning protein